MSVSIGLGSWADDEYTGILYASDVTAKKRLNAYAGIFNRAEVNSSFYRTPRRDIVTGWAKETPPGFIFDIKLHRVISQSPAASAKEGKLIEYLLNSLDPLIREKKLGVFLLVLAPTFTPKKSKLEELDL